MGYLMINLFFMSCYVTKYNYFSTFSYRAN